MSESVAYASCECVTLWPGATMSAIVLVFLCSLAWSRCYVGSAAELLRELLSTSMLN